MNGVSELEVHLPVEISQRLFCLVQGACDERVLYLLEADLFLNARVQCDVPFTVPVLVEMRSFLRKLRN